MDYGVLKHLTGVSLQLSWPSFSEWTSTVNWFVEVRQWDEPYGYTDILWKRLCKKTLLLDTGDLRDTVPRRTRTYHTPNYACWWQWRRATGKIYRGTKPRKKYLPASSIRDLLMITQMEVTKNLNRLDRVTFSPSNKKVTKNGQVKNFKIKMMMLYHVILTSTLKLLPQDPNNYEYAFRRFFGGSWRAPDTEHIYIYIGYIIVITITIIILVVI